MSEQNVVSLIIAEHDHNRISTETLKAVSAANTLATYASSSSVTVLVVGYQCQSVADSVACMQGVSNVVVIDDECYQSPLAENLSSLIVKHVQSRNGSIAPYTHIFSAATTFGKDITPRVAALLGVGQLSDVIEIESEDTVIRPIYAGNALAKVRSNDAIKVMTIRSSAFDLPSSQPEQDCEISAIKDKIYAEFTEFVSQAVVESSRPELPAAKVVVSGGRGLGSKENFALVEQLADKLGGAIGASRAAVDAGYVANDLQVGQTGKIVAPDLYIAVGISGAIQHLAGMKDSKVIVAINSDPDAPIFEIADFGLVGDLFEIVPKLIDSV
ncbi:FAD-binding protein [Vibrio sp. ZSDE26]|uniref:Electron transfer flavoprotein subunit alpha n=1 Tax=Vibrio amylolyticus TaxID=2847292 RepID=A0A9X1XK96_9VIBR|nr:FAD-binding protein [Vibrio amylolyticus]MCK6263433.1 FAD-binding protein [Vibrio amylolyticus]